MSDTSPSAPRANTNLLIPGAIIIGAIIIGICLIVALGGKGSGPVANGQQAAAASANIKEVSVQNEPYIGQENAPVTLAFWSDYQCPYCKAFEVGGVPQLNDGTNGIPPVLPQLVKEYVDTGKLKIVFKDFAFLGNDSITAAEYGRSIWKLYPNQYFAWRTAMYKAQDQEGDQGFGNAKTIDQLITSQFPQMDDAKIKADIAANKSTYDAEMQADRAEAEKFGISGTPGFITGTTLIPGFYPLASFSQAIDAQLK